MQTTHVTEGDTVLTYALQTEPSPAQVSPPSGPPKLLALTFVISAPRLADPVLVTQIVFKLPIADPAAPKASDLAMTAQGITASVTASDGAPWAITEGAAPGVFLVKPAGPGPQPVDAQGLTVILSGIQVSPIVGTAVVNVIEATNGADPRRAAIAVAKFPPGFFAGNFGATEPMVANGQPATLTWNGDAGANYTLLWGTHSRDVTNVRRWVSPPLTDTTTFILNISLQHDGQTVVLSFSVTVIVANPSLVARDLTVLTTTHLAGAVTGDAKSTLAALDVTGTATVASLVSRALQAQGDSAFANVTVGGQFTTNGHVSLFGAGQAIQGGLYNALTDGVVFASIGFLESQINYKEVDARKRCWGWVRGCSNDRFYSIASGGSGLIWNGGGAAQQSGPVSNSFFLPVQGGTQFWVSASFWENNETAPQVTLIWVPLGHRDGSQPTINRVQELPPWEVKLF